MVQQGTEPNTKVKSWSVAKAVSSAVVGVAIDQGDLDSVDQYAAEFIPSGSTTTTPPSASTTCWRGLGPALRHARRQRHDAPGRRHDCTGRQRARRQPPALWEYNNHSVQAIEPVLRAATGMAPDDYADAYLFDPIGMDVNWKRDETGHPAMYMNNASCRDNARLAYLFMKDGCWDGERILSSDWIDRSTSPSTSMNRGYGYWWWLNGEQPARLGLEDKGRMMHPFAPHDAYCGVGLGNGCRVIPSLDLVVRLGTAPDLSAWLDPRALYEELTSDGDQILHNDILQLVLDAIDGGELPWWCSRTSTRDALAARSAPPRPVPFRSGEGRCWPG